MSYRRLIGPHRRPGRPLSRQPWPEQPGERPEEVILLDEANRPRYERLEYVLRYRTFAQAFAARDARKKGGPR